MLALTQLPDIIHLGGAERISHYAFGKLLSNMLPRMPHARLNPCRQKDTDLPAPRPPDVSLDSSKAMALGFKPNTLKAELEKLRHIMPRGSR
jgi:dTDP-4-dehydrorhamnose reductase